MFQSLQTLPQDPLLGLIQKFNSDNRAEKIDLGVGVYKNNDGLTPVLSSVKQAEHDLFHEEQSKAYVGASGNVSFAKLLAEIVFGAPFVDDSSERLSALQTPGGCGALRVIAELIRRSSEHSRVWVSDPTWANHVPLLGDAGLTLCTYPYYDPGSHGIRFEAMIEALEGAKAGDVLLLHGCCHNPTGADLSQAQWDTVIELAKRKRLVPLIDVAYQGFGESLEKDTYGVQVAAQHLDEFLVAVSCSKNFGLYRERVGCAYAVSADAGLANVCKSHLLSIARGIYSMPPSHGACVVERILSSDELKPLWLSELSEMRERIRQTREKLALRLTEGLGSSRFDFIARQSGMFSFIGLNVDQVEQLASDYGIYMVSNGRVSISGLNDGNIDYFCHAMQKIL